MDCSGVYNLPPSLQSSIWIFVVLLPTTAIIPVQTNSPTKPSANKWWLYDWVSGSQSCVRRSNFLLDLSVKSNSKLASTMRFLFLQHKHFLFTTFALRPCTGFRRVLPIAPPLLVVMEISLLHENSLNKTALTVDSCCQASGRYLCWHHILSGC